MSRSRKRFPDLFLTACAAAIVIATASDARAAPEPSLRALVEQGESRRLSGDVRGAVETLRRAVEIAQSEEQRSVALTALGTALREAGDPQAAIAALREAVESAQGAVAAMAEANLALALAEPPGVETSASRDQRLAMADAAAARSADAALEATAVVAATAHALIARLHVLRDRRASAADSLRTGQTRLIGVPPRPVVDHVRLALGDAALTLGGEEGAALARTAIADLASGAPSRTSALASLGLGEAALITGDPDDATELAHRAGAKAAAVGASDLVFAAAWLRADARAMAGDRGGAAAAFAASFDALRGMRAATPLGRPPPETAARFSPRVFQRAYLDFLLKNPAAPDADLLQARQVVEDLKVSEIEEYFAARCVPETPGARTAAAIDPLAAVLYPIVLDDRIEMIVNIGDRLERIVTPIGRAALQQRVDALRYRLDTPGASVRQEAREMFDLIVAPIEPALRAAGVRTLVYAPDGPLRALPLALLWDGERFLVERYATTTILGLSLLVDDVDSAPGRRLLAAGVTAPPGYPPLPAVPREIAAVRTGFDAEVLLDERFTAERLSAALQLGAFDLVHLASHAEFGATPERNFIATADGRIGMAQLEFLLRARALRSGAPLDLLTLSACDTAAGDGRLALERAPLGLASVAYRSGARSVIASLWRADDSAAAALMTRFYAEFGAGVPRAEALRRAQASLLADPRFAAPFQWANFILIGDWR